MKLERPALSAARRIGSETLCAAALGAALSAGLPTSALAQSASAETAAETTAPAAAPAVTADTSAGLDTIPVSPSQPAAEAPAPSPVSHNRIVEEVVVTAQKREENLQDVPISIQAFSGDALGARGIENTEDLGQVVPSLQFTSVAGFSLVFIRGLGTDNFIPSADPSIATYIDGIYIPQGADTKNSLGNVKRVEVLKGPQGTLFGRNSTGGAISIVTEDPSDTFTGSLDGEIANFHGRSIKASVSGPLTSWLSASLDGGISRQDNPYDNLFFDTQPDGQKSVRGRLHFHPSDTLSLSLTAYYSDQQGLGSIIGKNVEPSLVGTAAGIQAQKDDFHAETDYESHSHASQSINYAVLSWKLPSFDIKLLGSYEYLLTRDSEIDFDGSRLPLAAFSGSHIYTRLQTGELQFVSNDDSWMADRFKWVTGLYYLHSVAGVDPAYFRGAPNAIAAITELAGQPQLAELGQGIQDLLNGFGLQDLPGGDGGLALAFSGVLGTKSTSAFVQGSYYFTDWLDLTLGGRFQHENRYLTKASTQLSDFSGEGSTTLLPFALKSQSENNFSPKAVLSLHLDDLGLLYTSYAIGFKSGTFNIVNLYTPPNYIEPEKVTTYEAGAKLQFFGGLLRLNGAVFHNEIEHLQSGFVSLLSGGAVRFITVPKARSRGAEIDGTLVPLPDLVPGLALTGNAAYVDAKYTDFDPCPGFREGTGVYSAGLNCTDNRIVRTPKYSGGVGVVQSFDTQDGNVELAVDEYYNSGFYYDAYNTVKEKRYSLLNARASYLYTPWSLRLTAFCQNLLDREYHFVQFQTDFGKVNTLAPPRQYGLRVNWSF